MYIVKKLSDNSKEFLNTYYSIIDQMKNEMAEVLPCDSISAKFIKHIIPLENGGINLSQNILKFTTNIDVENFAKEVIEMHTANLSVLNKIGEKCACVCNKERDVNLYMRKYNEIFDTMNNRLNNIPTSNNINTFYITSMMIHHESAINFAKNLLAFTICDELKAYAGNMITAYTSHLSNMRNMLKGLN